MLSANWAPASEPLLPHMPTGEKAWACGGGGGSEVMKAPRPAPLREGTRSLHFQPAPLPSLIRAALWFSGHLSEESPGGRRFLPLAGCSLASSSWPQPRGRAARWRVGGQREATPRLSHGWYLHPASLPIRPRALALPGRLRGL